MTLEYYGHSCFRLGFETQRLVLDPYADGSVPGLKPLRCEAEFVYCSHGHSDHNAAECVKILPHGEAEFTVEEFETDHDHHGGARRGKNIVRVFRCGGLSACHLGDLGRPLTEAEAARLQGLDLLMVPVGGHFTIQAAEAKELIAALRPRVAVLMHYRTDKSGYLVIAHLRKAEAVLGPVEHIGSTLEVTKESAPAVYAMQALNQSK